MLYPDSSRSLPPTLAPTDGGGDELVAVSGQTYPRGSFAGLSTGTRVANTITYATGRLYVNVQITAHFLEHLVKLPLALLRVYGFGLARSSYSRHFDTFRMQGDAL